MMSVVGNSYFAEHTLHALHGLGAIAASSDPRRLKMIRRGGREEAVGGCSCSRLGVIAASSDPGG